MKQFTHTYRAWRHFSALGTIRLIKPGERMLFSMDMEGGLHLRDLPGFPGRTEVPEGQWQICAQKNRRFIYLRGKLTWEIITWEADVLVLADPKRGDKLFFASLETWNQRQEPLQKEDPAEESIQLWSKSLIERVTYRQG